MAPYAGLLRWSPPGLTVDLRIDRSGPVRLCAIRPAADRPPTGWQSTATEGGPAPRRPPAGSLTGEPAGSLTGEPAGSLTGEPAGSLTGGPTGSLTGGPTGAVEPGVPLVELDCAAAGRRGNSAGSQHRPYAAGQALRYAGHQEQSTPGGTTLVIRQQDRSRGLEVHTRLRRLGGIPVLQVVNEVTNTGRNDFTLTYVSSLSLAGFCAGAHTAAPPTATPHTAAPAGPPAAGASTAGAPATGSPAAGLRALRLHQARNSWTAELRWQCLTAEQAGLVDIGYHDSPGAETAKARHAVTAPGSWSSGDFLPMGGIENTTDGLTWVWQIEHHGGWHWEVGDLRGGLYLLASGPTDHEHHWRQPLGPRERFRTVPVAVTVSTGGLSGGLRALTDYRRAVRRPSADHERLPVIFNDYMNCLMGDPTEERLAPLVAAAAQAGAEYFVIDAGWYADDSGWWDTVGEWEPSPARFPSGLATMLQHIRDAGMLPGLWLEPEVVGVRSPLAGKLPADAFFTDGGRRRQEHGRFHLDYRCAQVRRWMDAVVDRLVRDYGVRYLKLDYNLDIAPGTDAREPSPGAGLLGHNRAYLSWLDGVLDRYPDLVLENCASGGMRMDYALLSRLSLQSTSDQQDHLRYAAIAAAAPSAVPPEQGAVWAYPQPGHSAEEASFCLVNALLGRVHLSGRIDLMSAGQLARVRTAMDVYKRHRALLARSRPQWPLGLPGWYEPWVALAVDGDDDCLLAVWCRDPGGGSITLALPGLAGGGWQARVAFPTDLPLDLHWSGADGTLRLDLPAGPAARVIQLTRHRCD